MERDVCLQRHVFVPHAYAATAPDTVCMHFSQRHYRPLQDPEGTEDEEEADTTQGVHPAPGGLKRRASQRRKQPSTRLAAK